MYPEGMKELVQDSYYSQILCGKCGNRFSDEVDVEMHLQTRHGEKFMKGSEWVDKFQKIIANLKGENDEWVFDYDEVMAAAEQAGGIR